METRDPDNRWHLPEDSSEDMDDERFEVELRARRMEAFAALELLNT